MTTVLVERLTAADIDRKIREALASAGLSRDELEERNDSGVLSLSQIRALERIRRFEFLLGK